MILASHNSVTLILCSYARRLPVLLNTEERIDEFNDNLKKILTVKSFNCCTHMYNIYVDETSDFNL